MIIHKNYRNEKKVTLTEQQAKVIWDSFMRAWDGQRDILTIEELEEDTIINKQIKAWLQIESCPECGSDIDNGKCTNVICNQNDRG